MSFASRRADHLNPLGSDQAHIDAGTVRDDEREGVDARLPRTANVFIDAMEGKEDLMLAFNPVLLRVTEVALGSHQRAYAG